MWIVRLALQQPHTIVVLTILTGFPQV